jgi:hypothetical protein
MTIGRRSETLISKAALRGPPFDKLRLRMEYAPDISNPHDRSKVLRSETILL